MDVNAAGLSLIPYLDFTQTIKFARQYRMSFPSSLSKLLKGVWLQSNDGTTAAGDSSVIPFGDQ